MLEPKAALTSRQHTEQRYGDDVFKEKGSA